MLPALGPGRMLPAPWSPVLQKHSVLAAQDRQGPQPSAAGFRGGLTGQESQGVSEGVSEGPPRSKGGIWGLAAGKGGAGGLGGWSSGHIDRAEPRAARKARTGPRGGGGTHIYPPLPATPLFSPRAPDPLCTHRLRLCEDFLATGPGQQDRIHCFLNFFALFQFSPKYLMDLHCLSETPIISAQRDTCRYKLHFDFSL